MLTCVNKHIVVHVALDRSTSLARCRDGFTTLCACPLTLHRCSCCGVLTAQRPLHKSSCARRCGTLCPLASFLQCCQTLALQPGKAALAGTFSVKAHWHWLPWKNPIQSYSRQPLPTVSTVPPQESAGSGTSGMSGASVNLSQQSRYSWRWMSGSKHPAVSPHQENALQGRSCTVTALSARRCHALETNHQLITCLSFPPVAPTAHECGIMGKKGSLLD